MSPSVLLVALLALGRDDGAPDDQTLVFYNARLALAERRPADALKLWLMRNTIASNRDDPGLHTADFRSVVWTALGDLGLCPDGFPKDDEGAGLWPLAFHNWVVRNMGLGTPASRAPPFDSFNVSLQQRFVSLSDVLAAPELRSVQFFRTSCLMPRMMMLGINGRPWLDLKDRLNVGRLLRHLLRLSRTTLDDAKVRNRAVIEARIFDLDLVLADLAARAARKQARSSGRQARSLGVSAAGAKDLEAAEEPLHFSADSEEAKILLDSLGWTPKEWLDVSPERRLFLFAQARRLSPDAPELEPLQLGMIDALLEQKKGAEVERWLGFFGGDSPARRLTITAGERGQKLLGLDRESGFRERSVIALHRGVAFLEAGDLDEALRSFAFAMQHADDSRESSTTLGLARRWLSYVLSRHETSDELLATLAALVPRQDYNVVIEDLVWRAALRADLTSFRACVRRAKTGGAFDARVERLRPLAEGKLGELAQKLREGLQSEAHATLRVIRQLLEKLEAEDGEVRVAHRQTLGLLGEILGDAARPGAQKSVARHAEELLDRTQALLEGLGDHEGPSASARALSPSSETFAGSIRLAPADALPWPFAVPEPNAPSAFVPLKVVPVHTRKADGSLRFAWRVTE